MEKGCARRTAYGALCFGWLFSASQPAQATEYGLSDYILGLSMPMSGYTPPPGAYFWDTFYLYSGSGTLYRDPAANRSTKIAYSYLADVATVAWYGDFKILGGTPGLSAVTALVGFRNTALTTSTNSYGVRNLSSATGEVTSLSDSYFSALLGWEAGEHHWNLVVTGFAPTGNYNPDRLAQTGLNRPGIDVRGAYTFLSQSGTEVSGALGVTFNALNTTTNYQSGDELHFEWALNQHLPFGLAAGVGGYYYQQITNDHGASDAYGAFRGRVAAVGPLLAYTFVAGAQQVSLSARWFHEFDVVNRVRGDSVFTTLSFPL
ncbi:SphA family protein [Methylocapsa acidiphila]|uniref:SphA family protein n=1 Tax=Methylocapsa acidiphila TaxID=133552 RepID=UPI000418E6FA|nr:transporter [Methylocapsa acidiphila]